MMAANYDFYITCLDDPKWEKRILKKLQNEGFRGFHKGKFPLGGMKLRSRYNAVKDHRVKIIGFVSPSVKKSDMDRYIASLALEFGKDDDRIICVQVTKDALVPEEFSGLVTVKGWDEEELCEGIVECIRSVRRGGSVRDPIMDTRMRVQNQQILGHDEIDVAAEANREGVLEADTGVGDAGRKVPLKYWLIACGIAMISIIAFILLDIYPYFNSLSMEKKIYCALFICLIVLFFIGVIYNVVYFDSLSDTQKRSSIFAAFVIIIIILIALYDFNATLSYLESLSERQKVAVSCIIIIFLLILFHVISNIERILKTLWDLFITLWI